MKDEDLLSLLQSMEDDFSQFNEINMKNLDSFTKKDFKLEQGIINFLITTLPGDLKILGIDFKQVSWSNFDNSLQKILIKLKLVGDTEVIEMCENLLYSNKSSIVLETLQQTFDQFTEKIEELINSLRRLNRS